MESLISDLLAYSRATGTETLALPSISFAAIIQTAMENLRTVIDESQASITYDEMPEIHASPTHITQVLQNLIGNAIKYRRPGTSPAIAIRAEKQVDRWVFSVEDNGSGFDPKYAENMFGIFKRLHGADIPGTGIGLAICKAIVERHGGKIWAEGRPGSGATFWFTLPV
jgi:light-regulated signal transduction histidine kinase (bacteriophytochrome)